MVNKKFKEEIKKIADFLAEDPSRRLKVENYNDYEKYLVQLSLDVLSIPNRQVCFVENIVGSEVIIVNASLFLPFIRSFLLTGKF